MKEAGIILIVFLSISLPCRGRYYIRQGFCFDITSDSTASIINYRNKSFKKKEVIVPSSIYIKRNTYQVTCLESGAFRDCKYLETLVLPESINRICEESIVLCESLHSIKIPSKVSIIEEGAIWGNNNLERLSVDSSNCYYDSRYNCNAIIRKYDNSLIVGCKNTKIPDNINSIAYAAFRKCLGLETISIPGNIETVDCNAFCECRDLTSVLFNIGIKQIGDGAFRDCVNIDSINIPEGVTKIGGRAFNGCRLLKSVLIPSTVETIEEEAFSNCGNIVSIIINQKNKNYTSYDMSNIIVDIANKTLIVGCASSIIPDGIEAIGSGAFMSCSALDSINIPENLKLIEDGVFYNCTGLQYISLSNCIKGVYDASFMNCYKLSSIDLPDSLEYIGWDAFNGCKSLKKIVIPSKVRSIGMRSFMNCENMESVVIPEGVKNIGFLSFEGCNKLSNVSIYCSTPPKIEEKTFSTYRTLHVRKGLKKTYKKERIWRRFDIIDDL